MDAIRKKRIESLIAREIANYIQTIIRKKDDRIGLISVTRVELSPDLSIAKIYFSLFSPTEEENKITWSVVNRYKKNHAVRNFATNKVKKNPTF